MCFIYFTCPLYQLALEHGSSVYLKRNMFINPKKCNWNLPKRANYEKNGYKNEI